MLRNVFAVLSLALVGPRLVYAASSSTTSSAPAATHTISVGADGLNFSPNQLNASVGDILEYRFYPQNHSVARAAFGDNPCIPYELTGPGRVGFWSGFKPIQTVTNNPPIFRLLINDTDPLFFYCSSPGACLEGMVGVVNPNSTFSYKAQFNFAQNATITLSPGEGFPEETAPARVSRTTTATGATTTPTSGPEVSPPPAAAPTTTPVEHSHSSLSTGAIVGIAIGGFAALVLAAALLYMWGRQRTIKEIARQSQLPPANHTSYLPTSPGLSEAQYSNMHKSPITSVRSPGHPPYGATGDHSSYRSASPPVDERTQMMPMTEAMHHHSNLLPGSPRNPSTAYSHEMDHSSAISSSAVGMRPYENDELRQSAGPHEMPVPPPPERAPSTGNPPARHVQEMRPFSYADTPVGYGPNASIGNEKNDSELR